MKLTCTDMTDLHNCHQCRNWAFPRCKAGMTETWNRESMLVVNFRYFMPWELYNETGVFSGGYKSRCGRYEKKFIGTSKKK